jgi:hypothetical protein
MPAESKKQSRYLNFKFGHQWVKRHHFDNPTKGLPEYVSKDKKRNLVRHHKYADHHFMDF